jgi:uncharacterized protein
VVNHLRSLGGIDAPGAGNGDPVRTKRNQQTIYLAKLINGTSGEQATNWNTADNLVLVGDFNAYHVNDGHVDSMNCIAGTPPPGKHPVLYGGAVGGGCSLHSDPEPAAESADHAQPRGVLFVHVQRVDSDAGSRAAERQRDAAIPPVGLCAQRRSFPEGPTYRNDVNRPERVSDHDMPVLYLK